MIRIGAALLACFITCVALAAPARSEERIADFFSDISIARDGTLTVRELITVLSEGNRIQHGIFRDFPTSYSDRFGNRVRVRFDVTEVLRDGVPEPYSLESIKNGRRVRIGDANILIEPGRHVYVIAYETNRQVGFFDSYDEIYWNVTGNGWDFAIDHAEATVHLPPPAIIGQFAFYMGPQGAQGKDAQVRRISDTVIQFETIAPLAPREGLTVAVAFSKGAVSPPSATERGQDFLRDNAAALVAIGGLILLLAFYGLAWWEFGRDPKRGVIVPLFAPPKNFSPAAVRFVRRLGYDRKAFAAALVGLAVKGYLKISESNGTYTLRRTAGNAGVTGLSGGERGILSALFAGGSDDIELKNANHGRVSRAVSALHAALKTEDEGVYFVNNLGWFAGGVAILAVSAIFTALSAEQPEETGAVLFWIGAISFGTSFLFYRVVQAWRTALQGPGSHVFNLVGALFTTAFATPFAAAIIAALFALNKTLSPVAMLALTFQGIAAFVFYHLLKAPTLAGAKVRDEIEGFRLFLETAEKQRLEILHPPAVTPEVFEKFLPYAIALDAENAWSRKFEAETAEAGANPQQGGYTPVWYSGSSYNNLGSGRFASAIGGSLASATAAAATAPGSSSGSGGGGSAGGGGGGGGGGGW